MNQMIFLNGKQVEVIAYFEFESIKTRYLIYCNPGDSTTIYLGEVLSKDGVFELQPIRKMYSFLLKKFIKELIDHDLNTVKGYHYINKLEELQDNFNYRGSQEIVLDGEKKIALQNFILEINEHNTEILEKAKEEYYIQLVDEKAKERRTIILLLLILIVILSMIANMIINFLIG